MGSKGDRGSDLAVGDGMTDADKHRSSLGGTWHEFRRQPVAWNCARSSKRDSFAFDNQLHSLSNANPSQSREPSAMSGPVTPAQRRPHAGDRRAGGSVARCRDGRTILFDI
jgi:hypothetical protein